MLHYYVTGQEPNPGFLHSWAQVLIHLLILLPRQAPAHPVDTHIELAQPGRYTCRSHTHTLQTTLPPPTRDTQNSHADIPHMHTQNSHTPQTCPTDTQTHPADTHIPHTAVPYTLQTHREFTHRHSRHIQNSHTWTRYTHTHTLQTHIDLSYTYWRYACRTHTHEPIADNHRKLTYTTNIHTGHTQCRHTHHTDTPTPDIVTSTQRFIDPQYTHKLFWNLCFFLIFNMYIDILFFWKPA